jgi:hypothetical protein
LICTGVEYADVSVGFAGTAIVVVVVVVSNSGSGGDGCGGGGGDSGGGGSVNMATADFCALELYMLGSSVSL